MFGKYDFVSRAQGMLTLPEALHPHQMSSCHFPWGAGRKLLLRTPWQGLPGAPVRGAVTPWDLVFNKADISEQLGHAVATAFSSFPDAWFRSISVGTLE